MDFALATYVETVKLADFFIVMQILFSYIINTETFCYGDVLFWRRFVTGDVLLRRHFVTETFCMETFCRGDVLCGDVLYVRQIHEVYCYLL
jgi:hypothetical protein